MSYGTLTKSPESSNPSCSTIQSARFRTSGRIARKARVCARFEISRGPGECRFRRDSRQPANSSLGEIGLGPSEWRQMVSAFYYERRGVPGICIFIDGPHHDAPSQAAHDRDVRGALANLGFRIVAISHQRESQQPDR
jgi:hypothetical protein